MKRQKNDGKSDKIRNPTFKSNSRDQIWIHKAWNELFSYRQNHAIASKQWSHDKFLLLKGKKKLMYSIFPLWIKNLSKPQKPSRGYNFLKGYTQTCFELFKRTQKSVEFGHGWNALHLLSASYISVLSYQLSWKNHITKRNNP